MTRRGHPALVFHPLPWYNSGNRLFHTTASGTEGFRVNDITYVGKHTVIYSVSRHAHESWEFVYCTYGSGAFVFDDRRLDYREGDVVIIPPMVPHSNASTDGFQNIHINMVSPALSFSAPLVISDVAHVLVNPFFLLQLPEQEGGLLLHVVEYVYLDVKVLDFAQVLHDGVDADFEVVFHIFYI